MKNKNLKFVLSVICFIFLLLIIDFVINYIGESLLVRLPDYASGQIAKDNFRLNRIKTDIIIVGSSRGVHHYNANQLCDSINNYIKKDYTLYNGTSITDSHGVIRYKSDLFRAGGIASDSKTALKIPEESQIRCNNLSSGGCQTS